MTGSWGYCPGGAAAVVGSGFLEQGRPFRKKQQNRIGINDGGGAELVV